jgi:hypothetical protein
MPATVHTTRLAEPFYQYRRLTFGTMNVGTIGRDAALAQDYLGEIGGAYSRSNIIAGD